MRIYGSNVRQHLWDKKLGTLFGILKNGVHLICAHPVHKDNTHCEQNAEWRAATESRDAEMERWKLQAMYFE